MSLLKIEDITKTYASHVALDHVSFDVPEGSIFGLLGPNGAGKTSLIRIINQITGPDSGHITFNGERLQPHHIRQIGYLPEERGLYKKMKVGEQALYLAQLKGMDKTTAKRKLDGWFEKFDIRGWWDKKVEELSKGMAQKLQFITTVLHEPRLIILDEPFSGFDPINANLVKSEIRQLREKGSTIILSTHNMGSVEEICSHIALIHNSRKMLEGTVADTRAHYREEIYDLRYKGQPIALANAMWSGSTLISNETVDGVQVARIKLAKRGSVNQLLQALLPVVEIEGLNEVLPSMNDIFIKVVNTKAPVNE